MGDLFTTEIMSFICGNFEGIDIARKAKLV